MENNVRIVGITEPRGIEGIKTAEELIAYCARVSNPANQLNTGTASKLLKYLVKNQHWSPFEMVSITMDIKTTRDIGRQILRHRSFSFQEFSQRYAEVDMNSFIFREARLQDQTNRQNSILTEDQELEAEWQRYQKNISQATRLAYHWAIDKGIAKEQARVVLPEGMMPTHMYMSGTLRSWIHYCQLRMGNGTQREHKLLAEECWATIVTEMPTLADILDNPRSELYQRLIDDLKAMSVSDAESGWDKADLITLIKELESR